MTRPGTENHGTSSDPDNKEEQAKKASGQADVAHKPGSVPAAEPKSTESRDLGTKARSVGDGTQDEDAEQGVHAERNPESRLNPPT